MTEIVGKMPSIIGQAATAALNAVKNEIPNVSDLVNKQIMMQNYQTFKKFFTSADYDKSTSSEKFVAKTKN